MPDAPGLELILAEINRSHAGAVVDTSFDREQAALIVDPTQILNVLTWLKDTPGQEYTFLSSVHGVDYLPNTPRFAVHYELLNRERYERLRLKALLPDPAIGAGEEASPSHMDPGGIAPASIAPSPAGGIEGEGERDAESGANSAAAAAGVVSLHRRDGGPWSEPIPPVSGSEFEGTGSGAPSARGSAPEAEAGSIGGNGPAADSDGLPHIDSCVELFPTAEFQEREVYDFFGIVFDGHPDMRRILMPEDYVGWPQRRDFPVGGEPVIFTKDEVTNPGWWQ